MELPAVPGTLAMKVMSESMSTFLLALTPALVAKCTVGALAVSTKDKLSPEMDTNAGAILLPAEPGVLAVTTTSCLVRVAAVAVPTTVANLNDPPPLMLDTMISSYDAGGGA
jgi:hypothetical protein